MPPQSRLLTVKLLLFEEIDGRPTLTQSVAQRFVKLFTPETSWHASVRCVDAAGAPSNTVDPSSQVHYELQLTHRTIHQAFDTLSQERIKEAIETLCQEFCSAGGSLAPWRISPNPRLVFTVGVDPNSPTDALFLRTFVKHSAALNAGPGESTTWSAFAEHLIAVFASGAGHVSKLVSASSQGQHGGAGPLLWIAEILGKHVRSGTAGRSAPAQPTASAVNQAVASLDELKRRQAPSIASGAAAAAEQESAQKQGLSTLRGALLRLAKQQNAATKKEQIALNTSVSVSVFTALVVVAASALAAWNPELGTSLLPIRGWLGASAWGSVTWLTAKESREATVVMQKINHTQSRLHRRLYLLVVEMLRSDYRHRPDAATLARFAMDMAAAINPAALKDWDGEISSVQREDLDDELRDLVQEMAGLNEAA